MMMELPLDADGAACCRLHLPDHLPHAGLHDGYTFLQKVSRAILISHLLLHFAFFAYYFSLIIFLNRFSATKYITLNMYVYITGLW